MMPATLEWLRDFIRGFWRRPDELVLELGAGGELLVARLRALLSALILLLPLAYGLWGHATPTETVAGVGAAIFTNVMAQIWLALARRPRRHRWLPYATGTYDITSTSAVLALLATGDRVSALNSMLVWGFYLIGIGMTALRHDGRLTLYVGTLALVQYALIIAGVVHGIAPGEALFSVSYGTVSMADQVGRLMLILMMTLVTAAVVQRMQRLVDLSGNDGLTGLPNRTWLMQRMPGMIEHAQESGRSLTLCLLDVDYFQRVNEDYGHQGGDRVIRHLVQLVRQHLGDDERIVRLGGQEFVLLLQAPIGSAWERLDRIRRAIAEHPFPSGLGGESCRITVSGGLAATPQDGTELPALLRSADRRLQLAKRDGRNRVVARDA